MTKKLWPKAKTKIFSAQLWLKYVTGATTFSKKTELLLSLLFLQDYSESSQLIPRATKLGPFTPASATTQPLQLELPGLPLSAFNHEVADQYGLLQILAILLVLIAVASNLFAFLVFYKKPVFRKILSNKWVFLDIFKRSIYKLLECALSQQNWKRNSTWFAMFKFPAFFEKPELHLEKPELCLKKPEIIGIATWFDWKAALKLTKPGTKKRGKFK